MHEKAGSPSPPPCAPSCGRTPTSSWSAKSATRETAQIAVQASLTGHLVLSTLHTNDAPNAVTRLVDMGMEAYKIASALRGVVAQRLMRRICPACRVPATEPVPERAAPFITAEAKLCSRRSAAASAP